MKRVNNTGNTGYGYEANVQKAAERCMKYYVTNTEDSLALLRIRCDYYQVDYNDVIRTIKVMLRNN